MRIDILVNPHAGKQNILKEIDTVKAVFEESGAEVSVIRTESAEQAGEAIQQAVAGQPDLLICCGGDGTLSETVGQVLDTGKPVPLGYIPAGTTNDFAVSLGIPKDPVKAARHLLLQEPKPLDVGKFGDRKFIYVASFGAFTQSSYQTAQSMKNALGHLAYVIEGLKELPELKEYHVRAETAEGEVCEGDYVFGAVSNSTSFGGIVRLDPEKVDLSDGLLELILVKMPKNLLELNRVALSLMSGKFDEEFITFLHTRKAAFTCEEPMAWSLDGEFAPGGKSVDIEVLPQAIRLYY